MQLITRLANKLGPSVRCSGDRLAETGRYRYDALSRRSAYALAGITATLVPAAGLEPARPCGLKILSLVRLPIPPSGPPCATGL